MIIILVISLIPPVGSPRRIRIWSTDDTLWKVRKFARTIVVVRRKVDIRTRDVQAGQVEHFLSLQLLHVRLTT